MKKIRKMMFVNGNDIVGSVRVIKEDELNDPVKVAEFIKPRTSNVEVSNANPTK